MTYKPQVLVIEDEPCVADALSIVLSDNGYDVTVARTGFDGLDKSDRQNFDVTITDLRLPDMSGFDVITNILEQQPNSIIIVITAHFTPDVVVESIKRGAVDVLAKPFVPSAILTLLRKALSVRNLDRPIRSRGKAPTA